MPGEEYAALSLEMPKADDHFTDRDEPRELLANFFERLYHFKVRGDSGGKASLLNFYGVGGVGKSSLLKQAQAEFHTKYLDQIDYSQVKVAHLDLTGLQLGKRIPSYELFWKLRNELLHDQLRTSLFDSIYIRIWHADHPGQKMELPKTQSQDWAELGLDSLADLTGGTGLLKAARMLWEKSSARKSFNRVQHILGGKSPDDCDRRELEKALPRLLTEDIAQAFDSNPLLRVALCIDEYEQIQDRTSQELTADSSLVKLLGNLLTAPATRDRIGVVVMGREILRWDRVYADPGWKPFIESHILSGLSEQDARIFLIDRIAPWLASKNEQAAAQALIEHQDAILELTRSGPEESRDGCLPLHLDLIVSVVRKEAEKFTPALLVNSEGQRERIEERFLQYMKQSDQRRLDALQMLAFTPAFDRSLFEYLLSSQVIIGYRPTDFAEVLGGEGELTDSFVRQHPTWPGYYVFHGLMKVALVNSNLNSSFGTSGVKERLKKLLQFYIEGAQFDTPAEATELHQRMVTLGFDVIQNASAQQLLAADECKVEVDRLLESFDSEMALKLLSPIWAWLAQLLEQKLGPVHPDTLLVMNNLVEIRKKLADYVGVRALRNKVLVASESLLGCEHPNTLLAMENLADALDGFEAQKPIYEKVLAVRERVQGAEHPDTLNVMDRLALCLNQTGDLAGVKKLKEKILAASERLLSAGDADVLHPVSKLAMTLEYLGDTMGRKVLQEQVLLASESLLGGEHPNTLLAMEDLPTFRFDSEQKIVLQEKVLAARERNLGAGHPDTLNAMNNLVVSLCEMGDFLGAKARLEKVLTASEQCLGAEHPVILSAIENLVFDLTLLCDTEVAKALLVKMVADRERNLEAEHPVILRAMENLANALALNFDDEGSRALQKKELEDCELRMGAEHPKTLALMELFCLSLEIVSDFEGMRGLQEKVLAAHERSLGIEHPHTLSAMYKLARTLTKIGDFAGAKPLQEKMLSVHRQSLGGEDKVTLGNMRDLARTLAKLGDFEGAITLQEEILTAHEREIRAAGPEKWSFTPGDHLTACENLAEIVSKQGNLSRAKAILEWVVEQWEQCYGPKERGTLRAMENLANVLHDLGDLEGSKTLKEKILQINHA